MAKIKGVLEAANTILVLTPLADTRPKTGAERWCIQPHTHVDFDLPDGFYNVESVARSFLMIWLVIPPAEEDPRVRVRSSSYVSAIRSRRVHRPVH